MPTYKLTYFNARGRAEPARLLFALAGVDYEDNRVTGEEWGTLKPTIPTGQLPVLEVDGTLFAHSMAINRYLAREFNLAGRNNSEMCQVEGVIETVVEMSGGFRPWYDEKDEAKKTELRVKLFKDVITPKLTILEKMLANAGEVFVGKTITVADVLVFNFADAIHNMGPTNPLADYPKLAALKQKVGDEPNIVAWIAKRPVTPM